MQLTNTYGMRKETFTPRDNHVGIYVCGVTPYDTTHAGHAFTYVSFDVLIRYLRYQGVRVTYVQNVTDIDDDILRKAKQVGMTWEELGRSETRKFREVKEKLLFALTNAGQPFIDVTDANHENRGELLLRHEHQGVDLRVDYAREVLTALQRVWKRPVELHTTFDSKNTLLRYDGKEHLQRAIK